MQPLRRLRAALDDAAAGDLDFRISHQRRDEFGDLFESFNALVAGVQKRMDAPGPTQRAKLDATVIMAAANESAANDSAANESGATSTAQEHNQWSR
jgi:methyl-accepting chemotaxis protein